MTEQNDALDALKGWTEEQKAAVLEALLQEAVASWPDMAKELYWDDVDELKPSVDLKWLSKHWGAASKRWGEDLEEGEGEDLPLSSEEGDGEGEDLPLSSVLELLTLFSLNSVSNDDLMIKAVVSGCQDGLTEEVTDGLLALYKVNWGTSESEED